MIRHLGHTFGNLKGSRCCPQHRGGREERYIPILRFLYKRLSYPEFRGDTPPTQPPSCGQVSLPRIQPRGTTRHPGSRCCPQHRGIGEKRHLKSFGHSVNVLVILGSRATRHQLSRRLVDKSAYLESSHEEPPSIQVVGVVPNTEAEGRNAISKIFDQSVNVLVILGSRATHHQLNRRLVDKSAYL